jgi:hypothetical protein
MAKTRKAVRSAIDGRFKKKGYEKKHPNTTVVETVKIGKRKKKRK